MFRTARNLTRRLGPGTRPGAAAIAVSVALAAAVWAMPAQAVEKLTIAVPVKTVSFAPLFLAIDGGHFKRRGIEMKVVVVRGGTPTLAALLAGDVQFISVADDELLKVAKSRRIIRVLAFTNSFTQNLQVRNGILAERKITMDLPVFERVRRLKGITIGVIIPGGSSDLTGRWLFQQAGLNPKTDMKVLRIGGLPALIAALKASKIDAFILSAPAGPIVEATKIGKITVRYDEIPQFVDEPFLGIDTLRVYLAANRGIVKRVVEAVAGAQKEIYKDTKAAAKILQKGSFGRMGLKIVERSLDIMRNAYRTEKMTEARWDFVKKMRVGLGRKEYADVEMKEGIHWTNEFHVP